jgi:peptidoglycan/LPS O-acetylase OafA/YrhL
VPDHALSRSSDVPDGRATQPGEAASLTPAAFVGHHETAYRPDIDGLRAIAVLAVVAFHAFPTRLPGGFVGVDVFFVISGFLISGIIRKRLLENRFSFADFYARRIRRIVPALLVVLVACYAFGWLTLLPVPFEQLGEHIVAGVAFASNFVLWSEAGYFDASAATKPLLHLWSLGIEEQFYLVWPLALFAVARWRRGALVLVAVVGIASFAVNLATVHSAPVAAFYSPLSRFWELQLGCLLALLVEGDRVQAMPRALAEAMSIVGALMLAFAIARLDSALAYPGAWALLPTFGTFLLIAAGPSTMLARIVLSRRAMVGIGAISYPLYLWHWPLLSFAAIDAFGTPALGVRIAAVVVAVILATATYVLVEKPIRFGGSLRLRTPALLAGLVAIGAIGFATLQQRGVATRFPADIRALASWRYEYKTDARYPACWLSNEQPADGFAPACIDTTAGRPRVVLWGDSHAARLYPGLKAVFGNSLAISQFTRDACVPVLDHGYPRCRENNAWVVGEIARLKPETVVLFGYWTHSLLDWSADGTRQLLANTIDALHRAGVAKVVVLGPAPIWTGLLPERVYEAWLHDALLHRIPDRLATGLDPSAALVESALRSDVVARNAAFFSVRGALCTDAGCLTHSPDGATHLTSWDYGHLTTDGATIVARQLADAHVLSP